MLGWPVEELAVRPSPLCQFCLLGVRSDILFLQVSRGRSLGVFFTPLSAAGLLCSAGGGILLVACSALLVGLMDLPSTACPLCQPAMG